MPASRKLLTSQRSGSGRGPRQRPISLRRSTRTTKFAPGSRPSSFLPGRCGSPILMARSSPCWCSMTTGSTSSTWIRAIPATESVRSWCAWRSELDLMDCGCGHFRRTNGPDGSTRPKDSSRLRAPEGTTRKVHRTSGTSGVRESAKWPKADDAFAGRRQDAGVIVRALWINGTVGVGKTTVAAGVANQLATTGDPVAFVDIDALGALSPRPPDDPFNTRLVAKNLEAITKNFSTAGARTLVVAGVIETAENFRLYESAVGVRITLILLVAPQREIELRLRRRHGELDPGGLQWHSERAPVLAVVPTDLADRSTTEMSLRSECGSVTEPTHHGGSQCTVTLD